MRTSNYRNKLPITDKTWKIIWGVLGAGLLAGLIAFFSYYRVDRVEVMGSSHYSAEEIKAKVLRGPAASNSVLAPIIYTKKEVSDFPFVDGYTVSQINRNTICISVKEKQPVGCIPYLDSYIYFDRNGVFMEGSHTRDESVPFFDGIQVKHVILNEKLPIKGNTILNTAVALSTIFKKNQMVPDYIRFDSNYQITLTYGTIAVQLGKDENLEEKMSRVIGILPKIYGKTGILHMESISTRGNTFEEEVTEATAETWNGGYDEYGNYTEFGEYDENGKYVGPKPMTALDYAKQSWKGGYDGEGDYTGAGEYDENGTYVGPKPTQEMLDSFGDWTGGYMEDGSFSGYGQFDREGSYVGPNPNGETAYSQENGSGDGSDTEGSDSGSYDNGNSDNADYDNADYDNANYDNEGYGDESSGTESYDEGYYSGEDYSDYSDESW